jgi:hypothetical protein
MRTALSDMTELIKNANTKNEQAIRDYNWDLPKTVEKIVDGVLGKRSLEAQDKVISKKNKGSSENKTPEISVSTNDPQHSIDWLGWLVAAVTRSLHLSPSAA